MTGIENQRLALSFGGADLPGQIRSGSRVENMDAAIAGVAGADRSDSRGVALLVSHPELKVGVLEKSDLGYRAGIVMDPATCGQHASVSGCRQRDAGVADRVGPLGDTGCIGNGRTE